MYGRVLRVVIMVLCSVVLTTGGSRASQATEKKKSSGTEAVNPGEKKSDFDAHDPTVRYHFKDNDMDWTFGFLLGNTSNHGMEIGEAYYTASQIKDGDAASWQAEWIRMADRLAARAEKSLNKGHKVSAARQMQRASYYYRAGIISMLPDDPRLNEVAGRSRTLLRKAGELMDPPLEYFEVPFEGVVLPGYFRKADKSGKPRPTLFMVGGGETFAEDLWFHIAPQTFERGYNFVAVDLPGQGLLPWKGKYFRPAMNIPISAVIDYVLKRTEVDPLRFAAYGISGGGGFVPQTAMHDSRIKAVAVTAAVVDAEQLFSTMPVATTTPGVLEGFASFHRNVVKLVAFRWGVKMDNIPGLVAANKGFTFDPAKVTVPTLLLVGAGEYASKEVQRQQLECMAKLPNSNSKLIVTGFEDGASSHCIGENRSLMGEILFDWLDDVFKEPGR
ncbi:MAG: alpha/beta hydrolase [Chlorobiaceae bacterium]|nr:alpha/beta hydrolase [Chlorobiaceae bacterium]